MINKIANWFRRRKVKKLIDRLDVLWDLRLKGLISWKTCQETEDELLIYIGLDPVEERKLIAKQAGRFYITRDNKK